MEKYRHKEDGYIVEAGLTTHNGSLFVCGYRPGLTNFAYNVSMKPKDFDKIFVAIDCCPCRGSHLDKRE